MISVEGSPFKNDLLKDKTIWVTGGGTGLGKSMATLFSGLGAKVAISSRKEDVLKKRQMKFLCKLATLFLLPQWT